MKRRHFFTEDVGNPSVQDDTFAPDITIMDDGSFALGNIMEDCRFAPGNLIREDGKRTLLLDNKKNSMLFHENSTLGTESDTSDDFFNFQYSLRAPSFLSPPEPLVRLNSTEMMAKNNLSQYIFDTPTADAENLEEKQEVEANEYKKSVAGLTKRDSIFGSMVSLMPENPSDRKVGTPASLHKDKSAYTKKLLGIEDSRKHLGDLKADTTEYSEPTKKKLWLGRRVFRQGGTKDTKWGKRISPILVSPLSRKKPLTKADSGLRRGSF